MMGRYASKPQVTDTDYAWVIERWLDPDDEFNGGLVGRKERQVLCFDAASKEVYWGHWDEAYGPNILEWKYNHEAARALRIYLFGIEEGLDEAQRRLS